MTPHTSQVMGEPGFLSGRLVVAALAHLDRADAAERNVLRMAFLSDLENQLLGSLETGRTRETVSQVVLPELERCVSRLGFKGCLLNPDPFENSGVEPPAMGDRYWYPLYEKLCELDVPAHIHSAGSRSARAPYTLNFLLEETMAVYGLLESNVFKDFPNLKIVVSHGGGAIPYHIGRFRSSAARRGFEFLDTMRHLYYDTVLYSEEALRLLIKTVGADRCLFGAECPGVGSAINPDTGRTFDDIRPCIESFDWLSQDEKSAIFEGNARALFKLDRVEN